MSSKDGWQPDRPSRTSLPEPVAVEAARPVPRGRGRSNASPLPDLVAHAGICAGAARKGGPYRDKRPVAALPALGWWAGASSAGGGGSWRSARGSPSTREACTWRRGTAGLRRRVGRQEPPVNTGDRPGSPGRVLRSRAATQPLLVAGLVESPVPGRLARRVRRAVRGNGLVERRAPHPGPTLQRPSSASLTRSSTTAGSRPQTSPHGRRAGSTARSTRRRDP
jgi:hypothetical protein